MNRGEVLDGPERRRRWSDKEKSKILDDLAQPGTRAGDVARRYGVSRSLLYAWRKELAPLTGTVAAPTPEMAFSPVLLARPAVAPSLEAAAPEAQMIEIEVKGARVRLPPCVSAAMVAATIKALRGRS
jgi:transposase